APERNRILPAIQRPSFRDLRDLYGSCAGIEDLTVNRYLPLYLLRVLFLLARRGARYECQEHREWQHNSLQIDHTSVSFFFINSLASLGSALPLVRFITSPINILIIPF